MRGCCHPLRDREGGGFNLKGTIKVSVEMLAKLLCGRRTRNDFSAAEPQQWNLLLGRTCLDSVPAAEGDLLVRPDHPGAAAEIVSKFYASEKKTETESEWNC